MIIITDNIQSKEVDEILINEYKIPINILMENAAINVIRNIDLTKNKYIIVCGPGNNGADGLCIARQLKTLNKDVRLICPKNTNFNYNIAKKIGIPFINELENCDILIDCIFGTGISGKPEGIYQDIITSINNTEFNFKIISVDLPTPGIKPDKVIMLSTYKEDMLNIDVEDVVVENIGVPQYLYEKVSNKYLVDNEFINSIKIKRNIYSNKGDFGKTLIIAKKGAALLAVSGCVRSGSGYTYLLSDPATYNANLMNTPECININSIDEIKNIDVIGIGPGLSIDKNIKKIILENLDKKLVLDADALNILANNKELIELLGEDCILTPHLLEFARISDFSLEDIQKYPFECLKQFKRRFKGVILLKGKNTIITYKDKYYVINIGNSKMANAGMGDLLLGMISSYYSQGYSALNAAIYAAYRHAYIGKKLSNNHEIVNPTMIINEM